MKCPKCSFVSHDYLDTCRKCSIDLVDFKAQMHLVAIKPGVLDLSAVLDGNHSSTAQAPYVRAHDDLFGAQIVKSEEGDETFDISLDDDFGMTPTQIEELRAMRPGGDDEATEILPSAMATPGLQELRRYLEPQADERIPHDDTTPATRDPLGPPKTGYATVMIDLNDMEEIVEQSGNGIAKQGPTAAAASETPGSPDVERSSLAAAELVLPAAETEGPLAGDALETTSSLGEVDEMTFTAEDAVAFEATEETLGFDETDKGAFVATEALVTNASETTPGLDDVDEMTLDAAELMAMDASEAAAGLDEADEVTVIDEMVDFTSADASEPTLGLGSLEVEDDLALSDLTEMSLEVQDVEEMDAYEATELETALEMPSIDLEAALTAEESMTPELDDAPGDPQSSLQLLAGVDDDEDDLRLDFDELDLEDDEESSR